MNDERSPDPHPEPTDDKFTRARLKILQSEYNHLKKRLDELETRHRVVTDHTRYWESWFGPGGELLFISPACERITGYGTQEFEDDPELYRNIIHRDDVRAWRDHVAAAGEQELEYRIFHKNGRMRWVSQSCSLVVSGSGHDMGVRTSVRDITRRKINELQEATDKYHDKLTGVPNREFCLEKISAAMDKARTNPDFFFAVVFMDLDRFKIINDSLGHDYGDMILAETAQRLVAASDRLDVVGRFGGDEFVVLMQDLSSPGEAIRKVRAMGERIKSSFCVGDTTVHISASFGIFLNPTDYTNPSDLLQNAHIAMHKAKDQGRGRFKVFTRKMLTQARRLLTLENDLRRALANRELFMHYQPIFSLQTMRLTGFEALVRWQHPEKGVVAPDDFIPLAEDTGLIHEIGTFTLERACRDMASWSRAHPGSGHLDVAVNLSPRQFCRPGLAGLVQEILESAGLRPGMLKLEITENAVMDRPEMALRLLKQLKSLGVKISIDDFGTGYSSLAYLRRFPVDTLKVDRSFIQTVTSGTENQEIVRAIVVLAHSLGLDVVAEGVERIEQVNMLKDLACESVQGYYFHRPQSGLDTLALIRSLFG
jgi:diguanylate cyclase (GGDEF)-like protein/PAS domain S-box-containing protein